MCVADLVELLDGFAGVFSCADCFSEGDELADRLDQCGAIETERDQVEGERSSDGSATESALARSSAELASSLSCL